jgi:predicted GNAT family acetyltransferase
MAVTNPEDPIRHESSGRNGAFVIERDGRRVAELTYARDGDVAVIDHTWVDPGLRGGSAARQLVEAVVQWARAEHVRLVPACSYVRVVFARTPAYSDVQ